MVNKGKLEAKDGYINLPASLGEASPLQSSGDYTRSGISRDYELLTILYRENWIAKRIIDMPCEDATREWYTLSTELRQDLIDKIKKVEAKHNVQGEITNAMRWARLYGGSLALIVIKGQEDMLDEPLDYGMIMPDTFKGLLVIDMVTGITPSIELEDDMDDPDFGLPKYYDVVINAYDGEMVRIHHSRVLRFIGRDLPPEEEIYENYWGASELEHIYEELQKRNATSANIAQLVFQANTRVLKMADYGEVIGMGTNKQKKEVLNAIEAQNRLLTSFGVQIMGTDDNMENHPYSFSGISEVYENFMMDMAGAANIPATKLFGRSPQGMNATGESDMNNYYESIAQMQERTLKPALEKLLPVMCMSIFGAIPNDMEIVFEPIATTTPEQRANIAGQFTSTVIEAFSAGLIGRKTALMELKELGKDIGAWTKISDETIAEADDEVDNGEMMGGMGGEEMPPEMGGEVPAEGQVPLEVSAETQVPIEEQPIETQVPIENQEEDSSEFIEDVPEDPNQPEGQPNPEFERLHPRGFGGRFQKKGAAPETPAQNVSGQVQTNIAKGVAHKPTQPVAQKPVAHAGNLSSVMNYTQGGVVAKKENGNVGYYDNTGKRMTVSTPTANQGYAVTNVNLSEEQKKKAKPVVAGMVHPVETPQRKKENAILAAAKRIMAGRKKEDGGNDAVNFKHPGHSVKGGSDGGEGSGNFNHAGNPPHVGGSAPSGSGNHSTEKDFKNAVKECIKNGFRSGIDRKSMDKHRNLKKAEIAAKKQYKIDTEQYERDVARGKQGHEPVERLKSYFDGVNADFILSKALTAIDEKIDNKTRWWYHMNGGELRAQVKFTKPVGFTISKTGEKIPSNIVTVVFSRKKGRGFHCYPDWERRDE